MKQYYRIGDITIEYEGLPLTGNDDLAFFAAEPVEDADICCTLESAEYIAPIYRGENNSGDRKNISGEELYSHGREERNNGSREVCDMSGIPGHWKSDLEYVCCTDNSRTLYLTDREKNTEFRIDESTVCNPDSADGISSEDESSMESFTYRRHQAQLLAPYADSFGISTLLRVLDLPFEVLNFGGVFLHASYIEWKGRAILFTAPKQTGKSTQAGLWEKYNHAEVVNGDRALLRKKDGVWHAFGSPYCGTSHICRNRTLPVAVIVILGQAQENRLARANIMQSLQALLDGCSYETWDKSQVMRVMDLADDLIKSVPFWKLDCLPDESAVRLLEKVL